MRRRGRRNQPRATWLLGVLLALGGMELEAAARGGGFPHLLDATRDHEETRWVADCTHGPARHVETAQRVERPHCAICAYWAQARGGITPGPGRPELPALSGLLAHQESLGWISRATAGTPSRGPPLV